MQTPPPSEAFEVFCKKIPDWGPIAKGWTSWGTCPGRHLLGGRFIDKIMLNLRFFRRSKYNAIMTYYKHVLLLCVINMLGLLYRMALSLTGVGRGKLWIMFISSLLAGRDVNIYGYVVC